MGQTTTLQRLGIDSAFFDRPVVCPAGRRIEPHGMPGVFCRVEESVIDAAHDPSTLAQFCMGGYTRCSSWRADKENTWRKRLVDQNFAPREGNTLVDRALRGEDVPSFVTAPEA